MTEETKTIDQSKLIDHMKYLPGMEVIDSDMLDQIVAIHDSFNNDDFTEKMSAWPCPKNIWTRGTSWPSYRQLPLLSWKKWLRKPI